MHLRTLNGYGYIIRSVCISLRHGLTFLFLIFSYSTVQFGAQAYDTPSLTFSSQAPREYGQEAATEWLHMQVGGAFERVT